MQNIEKWANILGKSKNLLKVCLAIFQHKYEKAKDSLPKRKLYITVSHFIYLVLSFKSRFDKKHC